MYNHFVDLRMIFLETRPLLNERGLKRALPSTQRRNWDLEKRVVLQTYVHLTVSAVSETYNCVNLFSFLYILV